MRVAAALVVGCLALGFGCGGGDKLQPKSDGQSAGAPSEGGSGEYAHGGEADADNAAGGSAGWVQEDKDDAVTPDDVSAEGGSRPDEGTGGLVEPDPSQAGSDGLNGEGTGKGLGTGGSKPETRCVTGLESCDDECIDPLTDPRHCGGCERACNGVEVCDAGVCACPLGYFVCDGTCVDTSADPSHCGNCATICGAGQICEDGGCVCGVSGGFVQCGEDCVDLKSDPDNCGECGRSCGAG